MEIPAMNPNDGELPVSKDQWDEYRSVQDSGMFNMFTPQARELTSLSKKQWLYIIENYDELSLIYEGEE